MSVKPKFKTVKQAASAQIIVKKSKFIATVHPVSDEADALGKLAAIKSRYPDATHNVYAYIIDENNIFRYSDDGEPGGTAGMPVLDAMRKEGIVDTLIVVTRYFGGTLLGTGGLVHAYGSAAHDGLTAAHIVNRCLCDIVSVRCGYTLSGKIQHKISTDEIMLEDTDYSADVTFRICCFPEDTERIISEITDLTNGTAVCSVCDKKYVDID